MKEFVVLSGKGGGGKTTITAAFASLAQGNTLLVDADVDAANLAIIAQGEVIERSDFSGRLLPEIIQSSCISCGVCRDSCVFDAVKVTAQGVYRIDPYLCEGCSLCVRLCPQGAIRNHPGKSGTVELRETRFGPLIHASLTPPGENSGKLVTEVRRRGRILARERDKGILLVDGPPGIGCPAIAALTGSDYLICVIEATKSGFSDMKRLEKVSETFRIPTFVVVNRSDLHKTLSEEIENYALQHGMIPAGRVDYDETVQESLMEGLSVMEGKPSPAQNQITHIWENIWQHIHTTG